MDILGCKDGLALSATVSGLDLPACSRQIIHDAQSASMKGATLVNRALESWFSLLIKARLVSPEPRRSEDVLNRYDGQDGYGHS